MSLLTAVLLSATAAGAEPFADAGATDPSQRLDGGAPLPDAGPPPPALFSITGAVHNPLYQPIASARVEALAPDGRTLAQGHGGKDGAFSLPPLPVGSYLVRTTAEGYGPSTLAIDLGPKAGPLDVILASATSRYVVQVHEQRVPVPPKTGESVAQVSRETVKTLPGGDTVPLNSVLATQPGFVADSFGAIHARGNHGDLLYVIDGIPLPPGASGVFASAIPTQLVGNLQLITGGIPAEYGEELAGVVDITTRHGTPHPEGNVQLEYGSYQLLEPSGYYAQDIGRASVFVGGNFQTTSRGLDPPAATPVLHDQLLTGSAFTRDDYLLSDHDRIELIANYSQSQFQIPIDPTVLPLSDAPPGATRGPDIYGNPPPPFVPYGANPTESERDLFAALSYQHGFGTGASLQLSPYVRDSYGDLLCDPGGSLGATADPGSQCADIQRELFHEGAVSDLSWKVGEHQSWKAGLLFDEAQSSVDYTQYTRDDGSPAGGPDPALTVTGQDQTRITLAGVYLQDRMTFGKWTIFPGVRFDLQDASFVGTTLPNSFLWGPSARLGVSYSFTEDLVLHAFAGYLWQPPSALDAPVAARVLVPSLAGQTVPVDIKAERDEYTEVGLADRLFRKVTASLTVWGKISQDQLDDLTVGNTNLVANYNFKNGRAAGVEAALDGAPSRWLSGFGNVSWELGQGQGIDSAAYLFTPAQVADQSWQTLDHVQAWTANVGLDLHDPAATSHASVLFNYGSGLRTGLNNDLAVPAHATFDVTLRHRFEVALHPEVAIDVLNVFDEVYAIRIANGFVGSAYGALRQIDLRVTVPFSG
ncbi:MAG: TonB-dependent receptor [Myxococcales bacterium]